MDIKKTTRIQLAVFWVVVVIVVTSMAVLAELFIFYGMTGAVNRALGIYAVPLAVVVMLSCVWVVGYSLWSLFSPKPRSRDKK